MPATCAVCGGEIRGREFLLHRTEVIHRTCVSRAANSRRAQLEAEIVRLRGIVSQLELERDSALAISRTDKAMMRAGLENEIADLRRKNYVLEQQLESTARSRTQMREERDTAIAERDNARREAALHQTIRGEPVAPPPSAPPAASTPAPATDPAEDPTETRFRLLELDLPK